MAYTLSRQQARDQARELLQTAWDALGGRAQAHIRHGNGPDGLAGVTNPDTEPLTALLKFLELVRQYSFTYRSFGYSAEQVRLILSWYGMSVQEQRQLVWTPSREMWANKI